MTFHTCQSSVLIGLLSSQPHMNVEGVFYVNKQLEKLMFDELRNACRPGMVGGFLPGVKQVKQLSIKAAAVCMSCRVKQTLFLDTLALTMPRVDFASTSEEVRWCQ